MLIISAADAQLADSPSPMFKGSPKHTGLIEVVTNIETPYLQWKFFADNGVETTPAIGEDGTIYFGTFRDNFFALNPDGTEKWRFTREGEAFSTSPAIAGDGTIYAVSFGNIRPVYNILHEVDMGYGIPNLHALNPDGTQKWEFDLGGIYSGTISPPTIGPDGTVYVGSGGSGMQEDVDTGDVLWAINPDGTAKWSFDTGDAIFTSPAIGDDGTIYVSAANYTFYALTPEGEEKWRIVSDGYFDCSPAIGPDGTIYVGATDKLLRAVTPEGEVKWTFKVGDIPVSYTHLRAHET